MSFAAGAYGNPTAKIAFHVGIVFLLGVFAFLLHMCTFDLKRAIRNKYFEELADKPIKIRCSNNVVQAIPFIIAFVGGYYSWMIF